MSDHYQPWIEFLKTPEFWFRALVLPAIALVVGFIYKKGWAALRRFRKKTAAAYKFLVSKTAKDEVLTTQAIIVRSQWFVVFVVGGFCWFFFCAVTPFRYFLDLGFPATFVVMLPVLFVEIRYLSADSFVKDVMKER